MQRSVLNFAWSLSLLGLPACTGSEKSPSNPCIPSSEIVEDGLDQDCDGADLRDADQDGFAADVDCDDTDADVWPGAPERLGDGLDQDCDGADRANEHHGDSPDDGYGAALVAVDDGPPWVGAPWRGAGLDGAIWQGDQRVYEGGARGRLGSSLVSASGLIRVGEPGQDRVIDERGAVLLSGPGVGRTLASAGDRWVTSEQRGAQWDDGTVVSLGAPAGRLALSANLTLIAGFVRGDIAVTVGDSQLSRLSPIDEAGYALVVGDLGADGDEELVVGAPGAGVVYVLDLASLPPRLDGGEVIDGSGLDRAVAGGRFGAALAVVDGQLWVGAPMAGESGDGAVYEVVGGVPVRRASGDTGSQLGFALSGAPGLLWVGAPGAARSAGAVYALPTSTTPATP